MNIFKNLLFLHGYLINPADFDDPDGNTFARSYGNQAASDQVFAPLGHAAHARDTTSPQNDLCPTGACG